MCGRYSLSQPADVLSELGVEAPPSLRPRYNIAPTQEAPIVRRRRGSGHLEVALLRWGLIPAWAGAPSSGGRLINARAESAAEKPAFREALRRRRCLVAADGFFEWKRANGKQPFHIRRPDGRALAFGGLWERWSRGSESIESFTILTTAPSPEVSELHDRMPLILGPRAHGPWLDPELQDPAILATLLAPVHHERLQLVAVSRRVNRPENDDPECLAPLTASHRA